MFAALVGEGGFFVRDNVARGIGEGVVRKREQAGAGEAVEQVVELLAIVGRSRAVWSWPVDLAVRVECAEDGAEGVSWRRWARRRSARWCWRGRRSRSGRRAGGVGECRRSGG